MKKFKTLGKVGNVVAVIATFLVTFAVVYAAGSYFKSTYGTGGALSDNILDDKEWDALMEDLDTHQVSCGSCDSCCSPCQSCDGKKGYTSPDGSYIRPYKSDFDTSASSDNHDFNLYNSDGSRNNKGGIANYARNCGGTQIWNMKDLADSANGSKFCGTMSNCANGSYYAPGGHRWVMISVTCGGSGNPNYATIKKESTKASVSFPSISGVDDFSNDKVYLKIFNK